jgi:hypothetical protein
VSAVDRPSDIDPTMMRLPMTTILLCMGLVHHVSPGRAQETAYTNDQGKFCIQIPEGWIEIPKGALTTAEFLSPLLIKEKIQFVTGLQLKGELPFRPPFVLVQYWSGVTPPADMVLQQLHQRRDSELGGLRRCREQADQNLTVTWIPPELEKGRHTIRFGLDVEGESLGPMKVVCALCLGKNGIVQLAGLGVGDELFQTIVDSVQFEAGAEFDPRSARLHYSTGPPRAQVIDWQSMALLTALFIFAWGATRIYRNRRKALASPNE